MKDMQSRIDELRKKIVVALNLQDVRPDEIDPDFSATYDHYWNPTK